MPNSDLRIVAVDHSSLARDVEMFLDELRSESRLVGPTARTNPEPFVLLIVVLGRRTGFRMGVVECGRLVGLARIDRAGQVFMAITADRRGNGVGTLLCEAMVERAIGLGYHHLPSDVASDADAIRKQVKQHPRRGRRSASLSRKRTNTA